MDQCVKTDAITVQELVVVIRLLKASERPEYSGEGKTTMFINLWWFMSIKETFSMCWPCISNHMLQGKKREKEPKMEDTQTHSTIVPVECIHIQVTATNSCVRLHPVPQRETQPACLLQKLSGVVSWSSSFTMFYMLTVMCQTPREHPEPPASWEPQSYELTTSSTVLPQSYTNVPPGYPPRQANAHISHRGPFPSPTLPPQIIRLTTLTHLSINLNHLPNDLSTNSSL